MGKTQPIRNKKDIQKLKQYYLDRQQIRNYTMITLAVNSSLRIGDLLRLTWNDVYDFDAGRYLKHIELVEQKTGKHNLIALNREAVLALGQLQKAKSPRPGDYIFQSREGTNRHIDRTWAFRIIKNAVSDLHLEGSISCHSMRKTFGYHAWKSGVQPALLMSIYNHSSMEITKRYLAIDQDDRDKVFMKMNL